MGLLLKTHMDMILGAHAARGKKEHDPEILKRVDNVVKTYEGQLALRLLAKDSKYTLAVAMSEDHTTIMVIVRGPDGERTEFSEPREDFPSGILKAQIALLCG